MYSNVIILKGSMNELPSNITRYNVFNGWPETNWLNGQSQCIIQQQ
jgi:hypothetical protein